MVISARTVLECLLGAKSSVVTWKHVSRGRLYSLARWTSLSPRVPIAFGIEIANFTLLTFAKKSAIVALTAVRMLDLYAYCRGEVGPELRRLALTGRPQAKALCL